MKVLLTTHQYFPDFASGTETLTRGVARELLSRGIETRILSGFPVARSVNDAGHADRYEHEGIPVYRFRHAYQLMPGQKSRMEGDFDNRLAAAYFRNIAADYRPDVVHCFHLHRLGTGIISEAVAAGIPAFLTPTDFWSICPTGQLTDLNGNPCPGPNQSAGNCILHMAASRLGPSHAVWMRMLPDSVGALASKMARFDWLPEQTGGNEVRSIAGRKNFIVSRLNQLRRIVVPTRMMERHLVAHGVDAERIVHSAFGLDCHGMLRRNAGLTCGLPLRIGYIGTLAPHKGCHVLLKAFRELPEGAAVLRIHGRESDFPDYCRELHQIAGNSRGIEFLGEFPNTRIADVMAGLDVLVVPSLWHENSPLVIYSAHAAGCPVVGSDVEGIAEVVRDGVDGLLFPRGDAAALARTLSSLTERPARLGELSGMAPLPKSIATYANDLLKIWAGSPAPPRLSSR